MNTHAKKTASSKLALNAGLIALLVSAHSLYATDYNWNVVSGNWDDPANWSPNGTPGTGDKIDFNYSAQTELFLNGTTKTVSEIKKTQGTRVDISGNSQAVSILSVGLITSSSSNTFAFSNGAGATVAPNGLIVNATNITVGGGSVFFGITTASGYGNFLNGLSVSGTTTVSAGNLLINTNANYSLGTIEISGVSSIISLNNTNGSKVLSPTVSTTGINGTGGIIQGAVNTGSVITNVTTLAITNTSDFSTAALIRDSASGVAGADGILNLSKAGSGKQVLTGANIYTGTTVITGGELQVNGSHTGGGAYTIGAAGTLGGTGTISASSVTFSDGGRFNVGGTGVEDMSLSLTGSLDFSAVNTSNSLLFDLATTGASDKVVLSAGTLNIGTLNFSEFGFTALGGFGAGVYTLVDASTSIVGTLGTTGGSISGLSAVLSIDSINNDLILTVSAIPEPATTAALFGGLSLLGFFAVRRRRNS